MSDTCDQLDSCALPCPAEWEPRADLIEVYGVAVIVSIIFFVGIGISTIFLVKGKVDNFFVGGRDLPLFVVVLTLASQSIDSNATLGNADLAYKFHYWDGAVLPMGLGLSLVINGLFIARHINKAQCLTLPDFYGKAWGPAVEIVVSLLTCISFICLLAGNLVGLSIIIRFLFGGELATSVFIAGIVTMIYTGAGGLLSVAYTDVAQASLGLLGLLAAAGWMLINRDPTHPQPSVGFPGYLYPDDATCETYQGVPAVETEGACMYNEDFWGSAGVDNGAYPFGDKKVFNDGMMDIDAYGPFPNAILFNWATIFVLGFGNLAALDFQARCMAAKTPKIATMGNLIAAGLTFIVGNTFTFMGGYTRLNYGPDSRFASFTVDTCSKFLDLPACAAWEPDATAFLKLTTTQLPTFLGCWVLIGICAASMSTSDGAILAISTVLSHNIARKAIPGGERFTDKKLLNIVRLTIIPITLIACIVASAYNETGYLLIVAFDVVLAGCIAPLFAAIYFKKTVTPGGALAAVLFGSILRAVLEFALPKDGSLVIPRGEFNFDYGPGQIGPLPTFIDAPATEQWDPESCEQPRLEDWTGLDSLLSPIVSVIVMFTWSFIERKMDRTLWTCLPSHWLDPTFTLNKTLSKFHENVTDFGAALTRAVITNNTLRLANDTFFLGIPDLGSKLFICPCYKELSEIILGGAWKNVVVTGTPGIGKSVFGFYLLWLLRCQGKTVVFERKGSWYRFSDEGVGEGEYSDFFRARYLKNDLTAWYLSDPKNRPEEMFAGTTVVLVSPKAFRVNELSRNKPSPNGFSCQCGAKVSC